MRRPPAMPCSSGSNRTSFAAGTSPTTWVDQSDEEALERACDARRVETVGGTVLRSCAVVAELRVRHAEGEQPVRPVAQREGDLGRRGACKVRLDEDDVRSGAERFTELVVWERAHGRDVRHRHVT